MKLIILLVLVAFEVYGSEINPLSDDFINYINSKQNTWTAGRNFNENTPMQEIRKLLGAKKSDPIKEGIRRVVHKEPADIPESFDAREQWPECKDQINEIADQSDCGSCWAVSAASAMSNRRCIASKGKEQAQLSAVDILACCIHCGWGCDGGAMYPAWIYWYKSGVVTGGLYNSSEGCKPYPMEPCSHHINGTKRPCSELDYDTPACRKKCDDSSLTYSYTLTFAAREPDNFYGPESIQREILLNGPVQAGFDVYEDFLNYKSGIYQQTAGKKLDGHSVRIIGWGVENDIPYWLIANSWNEEWGENGYFRILRGKDEVGIEGEVYASIPKL